jgi:hypothetical protein
MCFLFVLFLLSFLLVLYILPLMFSLCFSKAILADEFIPFYGCVNMLLRFIAFQIVRGAAIVLAFGTTRIRF